MKTGFNLYLLSSTTLSSGGYSSSFSPSLYFAASQPGIVYDLSQADTRYTTSAGTTQAVNDNDPIGLLLDIRLWGGKSLAGVLAGQAEVFPGNFTLLGEWVDNLNGSWTVTAATVSTDLRRDLFTVGKGYRVTFTVETTAALHVYPGHSNPGAYGSGTHTITVYSDAAYFIIRATAGTTATVSAISVKEIPGNHASQPTAAARPTYRTLGGLHWIEGDGVDDFLRSTFTIAQPWDRVSGIRQITWTDGDRIFGGVTNVSAGELVQAGGVSPRLYPYSGIYGPFVTPALGTDVVTTETHNGLNSRIAVDNDAYVTGDAGTILPGGLTLFATSTGSNAGNARIHSLVMRQGTFTDNEIAQLRTWIAEKQGRVL